MCGIAGLIHRGKSSNVGEELQSMLQALKHRGPDSTGYALYADNDGQNFILRFKVGETVKVNHKKVDPVSWFTILKINKKSIRIQNKNNVFHTIKLSPSLLELV